VEASGLLSWGGASALAAVAVARWRPHAGRGRIRDRVRRHPIDIDLVRLSLVTEEVAMDGSTTGDRSMAMSTQMPPAAPAAPAAPAGRNGTQPPTGLPPEQLYTWLEWVQDDLRRIEARLEYLEAARTQLREQERLLGELLHSSGPLARH
jgi:hypothetical protein